MRSRPRPDSSAPPGDLVRFFRQLDPAARKSLLSVASRRELTRRQWRVPDSSLEQHYGLGTVHRDNGDWAAFGHSGGFQGFITHTAVIPAHGLTFSILTNAIDGAPAVLFDGCVHILRAFAKHGPPSRAVADWRGRWWSSWGTTDLVPMGKTVLCAAPALANPFADASELSVARKGCRHHYQGERLRELWRRRPAGAQQQGKVTEVRVAATRLRSERAMAREMQTRYGKAYPPRP